MISSSLWLLLLLAAVSHVHCVELTQTDSVVLSPGQVLTLSCKLSGYSVSDSSYCTDFIRQPAGKALEWVGDICGNGNTYYSDKLKSRFQVTRDSSNNTVTLQGQNMQIEDTSVYYCARTFYDYAYFDYWGKGTSVTVTSAESSPPTSIFAMSQCTPDSTGYVTIGCMARGFSPADSLTFKWTDYNTKELSDFVQYPAFASGGEYTKVSHMRVRKSDLDPQKPYKCEASNSKGKKDSKLPLLPPPPPPVPRTAPPPVPRTAPPPVPRTSPSALTLKPPVQREIFVYNKVVLEADVSGDIKSKPSCKVNDADIKKVEFSTNISPSIKKYNVTVDTEKWFNGEKVTCTIGEIKQEISFNKGDGQKPTVFIYRPDNIITDRVSHVCEVTSPKLGDVYVMWKVGNGPYREGGTSAPIEQKNSMSVLSILTMKKEEYEKLSTTITCAVIHANMDNRRAPLQVSTSQSEPPEPETGFALDCNKDVLEEDEFRSLWSTATSFIFLFLFSLTYSAVLSFFKVKQ